MEAAPETQAEAGSAIVDAATLTPMMKQYLDVKAQVPGALLFFRLGDFYELFFEDAVKAAELLQITLTSRAKGLERVPMCGVPHHAARRYVARLIEAGERVAICEQLTPPGKGIVKREVVRVVTPGMVLDDDVLEAKENNFLAAVLAAPTPTKPGARRSSTPPPANSSRCSRARWTSSPTSCRARQPRELLVPEGDPAALEPLLASFSAPARPGADREPDAFVLRGRARCFCQHFGVQSLEGFGLDQAGASIGAAGAALRYVQRHAEEPGRARRSHLAAGPRRGDGHRRGVARQPRAAPHA